MNPSGFSANGLYKLKDEDTHNRPVEDVSNFDAMAFCTKLSKQEQLKPFHFIANGVVKLLSGDGYRLPTEAEWEYACRAGTFTTWFHGEQELNLGTVAWFRNSGGRPHAVGQLKANPFGLFDVHGNVFEWCQDWYDAQAYTKRQAGVTENPQGPKAGAGGILRGGGWVSDSFSCRSAFRYPVVPKADPVSFARGFRVLLGVGVARSSR